MSENDISTAETAQSDQYYQRHRKPLHCPRHRQQCSNCTNTTNIGNNWQHQTIYSSLSRSRGNLTTIDVATPPQPQPRPLPLPLPLPSLSTVCNNSCIFNGTTGCDNIQNNSSNINNNIKCVQLLQHNSLGLGPENEDLQYESPLNVSTQTDLLLPPENMSAMKQQQQRQQQQHYQYMAGFQSPHARRAMSSILLQHDFFESCLTPPPPPLGYSPTVQQRQQQQQQQHQHHHAHKHTHQHSHLRPHFTQHCRSQDRVLQHLTPSKISTQFGGGGRPAAGKSMETIDNDFDTEICSSRRKNLVDPKNPKKRLHWIVGIAFGIFCLVVFILSIYLVFRNSINRDNDSRQAGDEAPKKGIKFFEALYDKYGQRGMNATWSKGTNLMYNDKNDGTILEYNVRTGEKTIILPGDSPELNMRAYGSYLISADRQFALFAKPTEKLFRYSSESYFDFYDINAKKLLPLLVNGQREMMLIAKWSPVGNALIFNYHGNIYYKPSVYEDEIAITHDDNPGILNGVPDWVYEEEVFQSNSATWFNTDGTMIAFIRFDDTPVGVINIPIYGKPGDLAYQYPHSFPVLYPKAGSSNPIVQLFTANLMRAAAGQDALTPIPRPSELNTEGDSIITMVYWLNKKSVLYVWMNRIQNAAYIQAFDGVKRTVIYNIESKSGWVDLQAPLKNRDGSRVAFILPQVQDDSGPYKHLCLLSTTGTSDRLYPPEALTKGKYVVQTLLHWDTSSDIIFYTANTPQQSEIRHIYAIKALVGQQPQCVTCNLKAIDGIYQNYYGARFASERYLIMASLGPDPSTYAVYEWSYKNNQVSMSELIDWENNNGIRKKLSEIAMPTIEIHNVPIKDSFTAKVQLQFPANMDRSGKTKYPMIVEVYGGPSSAAVITRWSMDSAVYMITTYSIIYAKIDGRGSDLRGDRHMHSVYLKLGTVEIEDQISVTRYLQNKFDFIDGKRTGIWGWSYGGYASAMALARDKNSVFQCAVSVAPVTDWLYYDTIYTERYMSLPSLNPDGYNKSRLTNQAEQLRGKSLLIAHGTLDDNVHMQQTMVFEKALEYDNILFEQITYTDEDHSLSSVRPHLFLSINRFFGECLGIEKLRDTT